MEPERWKEITGLFVAALELPEVERPAFLAAESGGDPELRQAVERMLAADGEAGDFLARAAELPPPVRIGRYDIIARIGRGGFGEVFQGWDPVLKRPVAVKTCLFEDADLAQRFSREAEIAARLDHPNVTVVHDLGAEGSTPYLVQELLPGEDLDRIIAAGRAGSLGDRLDLLVQVARGLAYAHARGVIHRDVKPGNVRVLPDGRAKIMDFGIARLAGDAGRLTRTGAVLGTIAYMAPEQIRGEEAGERADVYSFGAVAYELLTGRCPFRAESGAALLYQALEARPEPLEQVWPACPPDLAALVERCLAKDPAARWPGFPALLAELEAIARALDPGVAAATPAVVAGAQAGAPARPRSRGAGRRRRPVGSPGALARAAARRRIAGAAAAAGALIAVGLGARYLLRPPAAPALPGRLLIDARPWAQVTALTDGAGRPVTLGGESVTPLALPLPPGEYTVVLANPRSAEPRLCRVRVEAAGLSRCDAEFARVEAEEFLARMGWR